VRTAVRSDIVLPYNASGGRRKTSGWELACSLVRECHVSQHNTQKHPFYCLQLAAMCPTVNYSLASASTQSQIYINIKSHSFTLRDMNFSHFNPNSRLYKSFFRGLWAVPLFRPLQSYGTMLRAIGRSG